MLHDVFVDNVSKRHDEHGFHCTHMRWNCIQDDLNHVLWFRRRPIRHFVRFFLKSSTRLPHQHGKVRLSRKLPGFSRIFMRS